MLPLLREVLLQPAEKCSRLVSFCALWYSEVSEERTNRGDAQKSLTTSDKSSTLEAPRTFVLIRSTTGWDRPLAPPNCCLIWANAGRGELIPANARF